jgi:hypothetical protein
VDSAPQDPLQGYAQQPQPQYGYAQPQPQPYAYGQPQAQYAYAQPGYAPRPGRGKLIAIFCVAGALVTTAAVLLAVFLGGPSVPPEKLNGIWDGTIKIEKLTAAGTENDLSTNYLGNEQNVEYDIELDEDGKGTLTLDGARLDASLRGGRFTASGAVTLGSAGSADITMEGSVRQDADAYWIEGTWKIAGESDVFASGTWRIEIN